MKKKIIFLFIFLFIIIFIYILIKSEFKFPLTSKYFKYLLIDLSLLAIFAILFFLNDKTQEKILVLFVSILIGLYIIEFTMPLYVKGLYNKYDFVKEKKKFIKIYSKFKEEFPDGYPSWNPSFIKKETLANLDEDIHVFAGIPNNNTYHCSENKDYFETDQVYKSDRYGFNNPDYVYNEEDIEIVLIGDSFVHGQCVGQENGYAGNLRKLFGKKGIISVGWRGAGPFEELGMLTEYGLKLNPKYILWVYFEENDYIDIFREQKNPILINYLNEGYSQNLINRTELITDITKKRVNEKLKEHFHLNWDDKNYFFSYLKHRIKLWNIRWQFFYRKKYMPNQNDFDYELFKKIFSIAKSRSEKQGSKFIFVYQPGKTRYEKNNIQHNEYLNKSKILDIVKSLSIPIIDVHEAFVNYNEPLKLWYAHTNEEGYKLAAEHMFNEVNAMIKE